MYVCDKFLKWAFTASGMTNPNVQETYQVFSVSSGGARSGKPAHLSVTFKKLNCPWCTCLNEKENLLILDRIPICVHGRFRKKEMKFMIQEVSLTAVLRGDCSHPVIVMAVSGQVLVWACYTFPSLLCSDLIIYIIMYYIQDNKEWEKLKIIHL